MLIILVTAGNVKSFSQLLKSNTEFLCFCRIMVYILLCSVV